MNKLDFGFLTHDDVLEARVDGGYYHIGGSKNGFYVSACVAYECCKVGEFSNIYDALEAANKHFNGEKS